MFLRVLPKRNNMTTLVNCAYDSFNKFHVTEMHSACRVFIYWMCVYMRVCVQVTMGIYWGCLFVVVCLFVWCVRVCICVKTTTSQMSTRENVSITAEFCFNKI